MKRIGEKLKSSRGASILFAILIFMLCILAGTSALTAASANAGRYTHLEEDQRKYLSVSSAINMFKAEFTGKEFTASREHTKTETWTWVSNAESGKTRDEKTSYALGDTTVACNCTGAVGEFMKEYLTWYFNAMYVPDSFYSNSGKSKPDASGFPQTRLRISGKDDLEKSLTDVYVTVSVDGSGDKLALVFTFSSGNDTDGGAYVSTLRIEAESVKFETPVSKAVVEGVDGNSDSGERTVTTTAKLIIEWGKNAVVTRVSD